jgi:hypothetical protein
MYDAIIIGGGPAGFKCGATAGQSASPGPTVRYRKAAKCFLTCDAWIPLARRLRSLRVSANWP